MANKFKYIICLISLTLTLGFDNGSINASSGLVTTTMFTPTSPNDEIKIIYITQPVHLVKKVNKPLFVKNDNEKIKLIARWIEETREIKHPDLSTLKKSRALNIIYVDGHTLQIRPATNNLVSIQGGNHQVYFSDSPELLNLLNTTYLEWMPFVDPYELNRDVQKGDNIYIKGNGWLTDKISIEISNDHTLVWNDIKNVNTGEFSISIDTTPFKSGKYEVVLKGIGSAPHLVSTYVEKINIH